MDASSPPVWLLRGPPDETLRPQGWHVVHGFDVDVAVAHGGRVGETLCVGTLSDESEARAALAAWTLGAALAVHVDLGGGRRLRLLEDLHKLGVVPVEGDPAPAPLPPEQARLLDLLAAGATVTAAARQLSVSRRTGNRLLLEARQALGVGSNVEAITAWAERSRG